MTVGTVTAQLLYEIGSPAYANPDATAHFDSICLRQDGPDRVAVDGVRGSPPPDKLKVALNYAGGYRNTMTMVITGLDVAAGSAFGVYRSTLVGPTLVAQTVTLADGRCIGVPHTEGVARPEPEPEQRSSPPRPATTRKRRG